MAKVGDKVKFTQANSPYAQAQTFDAEILLIDVNDVASLKVFVTADWESQVDSVRRKSAEDTGDYPTWE